ncbi:MAG: hypothetical protein R3185_03760 [Candidatus Thermoplasmatota archaeon]|nr:hypothetical protein [Candidatus Thermoplasmatota archaeon]
MVQQRAPSPSRRYRATSERDGGVTVIVGLLLAIAIITALLVNYRLQWVPLAMEDVQAAHMDEVDNAMGALVATLDKQLIGEVNHTVSSPFQVGIHGKSFPTMPPVSHRMTFTSATTTDKGMTVDADQVRIFEQDGTVLGGLSETYSSIGASTTVTDVQGVDHLRIKIDTVTPGTRNVRIQITNATGVDTGWFEIAVEPKETNNIYNVTYETRDTDATGTVLYDDRDRYRGSMGPFYVDVMEARTQFPALLAASEAPYDITFTSGGGWTASYAMTYEDDNGVLQASGGITHTNYQLPLTSASITYTAENPEFVDQSFVVESGALLLNQDDGTAFLTEPRLTPEIHGTTTVLSLTVPRLTVSDQQLAGVSKATVKTTPVETGSMKGWVTSMTLTWNTDYPSTWQTFLDDAMSDAGIPASYYSTATTATTASLTVDGADPGNEDILLILKHTRIKAEVLR